MPEYELFFKYSMDMGRNRITHFQDISIKTKSTKKKGVAQIISGLRFRRLPLATLWAGHRRLPGNDKGA